MAGKNQQEEETVKTQQDLRIIDNQAIARETFRLTLDAAELKELPEPGTFYNLTVPDHLFILKRPISVFAVDREKQRLELIYKVMGAGTKLFSEMKAGDRIQVMGPLGTGFPIQEARGRVLLIGGGVGVPPLHELGCRLKAAGHEVVAVLGFRDRGSVFCEEEFRRLGETVICTDDGSYGYHGLVTGAVKERGIDFEVVYACGPRPMLRAVDETWRDTKKGWLSFEERMACGIGACYGCMTETKAGLKRVCKDGPVFALGEAVYYD